MRIRQVFPRRVSVCKLGRWLINPPVYTTKISRYSVKCVKTKLIAVKFVSLCQKGFNEEDFCKSNKQRWVQSEEESSLYSVCHVS